MSAGDVILHDDAVDRPAVPAEARGPLNDIER